MKERPILFSASMVRAVQDGAKTQTRRVITNAPPFDATDEGIGIEYTIGMLQCPHGQPGDRLWARESLRKCPHRNCAAYAEDNGAVMRDGERAAWEWQRLTLPSIYMPRWASRLTLNIEIVRAERVQDISEADAVAEGVVSVDAYAALWDAINAKRGFGWNANPWVWVITFRKLEV